MKKTSKILAFALALLLLVGGAGPAAFAADGDLLNAQPVGAFVNRFTDNVMDIFILLIIVSGEESPLKTDVTDIVIYYNGTATPVTFDDVGYMNFAKEDDSWDSGLQLLITPTLEPLPGLYYATFKYRGVPYGSSTLIVEHTGIGGTSYDESTFGKLDGAADTKGKQPEKPAALVANPTASTVYVNGQAVAFDAYNINGNNYFKLRDLAYILNGTEKQFEVAWDGAANAISLTSGQPYTAVGGEMTGKGDGAKTPSPTSSKILLDGAEVSFTAYNIDGNNYFKLRDIGAAFDFGVDWDGANNAIMIDTSKGYTPE